MPQRYGHKVRGQVEERDRERRQEEATLNESLRKCIEFLWNLDDILRKCIEIRWGFTASRRKYTETLRMSIPFLRI